MATALSPTGSATSTAALSRQAVETGADGTDPSVPSAAYRRMEARWNRCRDCLIGTEAIRAGGTSYLAQYSQEDDNRYEVRRDIAAFYNGYARTVLASVGMLLEEEPTLGKDMPSEVVKHAENIDAAGTHLTVFVRRLATAGIVDSYAGILVEHSRRPDRPLSGDEEARLGLRPYFLLFRADDVIRTLYESVNGVRTLVLLILREVVSERHGPFGTRMVTQYRIYTNEGGVISYQLWRSPDSTGGRPALAEGPATVTNQREIPWAPFIAGEEIAPGEYKPPLLDLADLNIQYHNTLTNILSLQALAFVPTPVRIGASPNDAGEYPEVIFGPSNTIEAPLIEGVAQPIYWLSPPIDVLAPGERMLTSTKADMGAMGAAFLSAETRAAETAEGKRIDSAAQRATLSTVSRALKDCLERAFGFMAAYILEKGGSVTLNDDFTGESIDPQYLAVLVNAFQQNVLALEELRYVIQTGQLPEDFDAKDTLDLIARQMAKEDAERQAREDAAREKSELEDAT